MPQGQELYPWQRKAEHQGGSRCHHHPEVCDCVEKGEYCTSVLELVEVVGFSSRMLPKARVVYCSATGVSDVKNLVRQ